MKYVCQVCGYVHEGDNPPEKCPQCGVDSSKFTAQSEERSWAAEHVVGVAQGVREDIIEDLRANFNGELGKWMGWSVLTKRIITVMILALVLINKYQLHINLYQQIYNLFTQW